jgi:hypothetical protein
VLEHQLQKIKAGHSELRQRREVAHTTAAAASAGWRKGPVCSTGPPFMGDGGAGSLQCQGPWSQSVGSPAGSSTSPAAS